MSLVSLRKCPVEGCHFNAYPVFADRAQIEKHILLDHDYKEKLEAAVRVGIISNVDDHRSPQLLASRLAESSRVDI